MKAKPMEASMLHADLKLNDLKRRVQALENVRTVVTVRTRQPKSLQ
jgi:hypothetical protein